MIAFALALALVAAEPTVVDFEGATVYLAGDKANRLEQWVEKGVTFRLAHEPRQSKAKGLVMFFEHLATGRKGIGSAMALEAIPVRATFAQPVSSVTVSFWGSTGVPAVLEALDAEGQVVDRAIVAAAPLRQNPGDPVPVFALTVKAARIASVQFSGPRPGEYLVADELRFQ